MQCVLSNGIVHHYRDDGARGGDAIVFINSLGTDLRVWDAVAPAYQNNHRVIRYDKRGHGLSGLGPDEATIDQFAGDLDELLGELAVERATIVGLSIGGLIALGLYARSPQRVRSLFFADTAHRIGDANTWNSRIATVLADGLDTIADPILERWFTPGFRKRSPVELAGWRNMLVRTPARGYATACAAIRDADFTETARRVAVPATCVVGDQDGSTPVTLVEAFAGLVPQAHFSIIADAGHLPGVEQPAAFIGELNAHLAREAANARS
ncbi:3-oxoadipate enol-lactonase [Bosea sp. PAMC 26642]|uniref:3-oxoadipate enol-lactonase n=1 Tax=Bosea sp. (strain PAMC 26642) TaxID=1792307 RepID=UPI0007704DB5|nr:3-oxoadipate enol-lactonase [Bosea sp. PAMC 26642]AMJ60285.1 3-oxoadipate enol-lactonase [Bosea sp. PAMC 26642]